VAGAFAEKEKARGLLKTSLDNLFNNAGVFIHEGVWDDASAAPEDVGKALLQLSEADWSHEFFVNTASVQVSPCLFFPVHHSHVEQGALCGGFDISCLRSGSRLPSSPTSSMLRRRTTAFGAAEGALSTTLLSPPSTLTARTRSTSTAPRRRRRRALLRTWRPS
jgi:NAD(P)-dependent dehydrogenase (short-subunit alcohol dehydrogenase family)